MVVFLCSVRRWQHSSHGSGLWILCFPQGALCQPLLTCANRNWELWFAIQLSLDPWEAVEAENFDKAAVTKWKELSGSASLPCLGISGGCGPLVPLSAPCRFRQKCAPCQSGHLSFGCISSWQGKERTGSDEVLARMKLWSLEQFKNWSAVSWGWWFMSSQVSARSSWLWLKHHSPAKTSQILLC